MESEVNKRKGGYRIYTREDIRIVVHRDIAYECCQETVKKYRLERMKKNLRLLIECKK